MWQQNGNVQCLIVQHKSIYTTGRLGNAKRNGKGRSGNAKRNGKGTLRERKKERKGNA